MNNNFHSVAKGIHIKAMRKAWASQSRRITDIIKEYPLSCMSMSKEYMLANLENEGFHVEFIMEENAMGNERYMIYLDENTKDYFIFSYKLNGNNAIAETFNTYVYNNDEVHYLDFLESI